MQEIRAAEAAARAAESRKRAEAEKRAAEAAASAAAALGVKQRAEMDARADHLRKQRDLILAQRRNKREADAFMAMGDVAPAESLAEITGAALRDKAERARNAM